MFEYRATSGDAALLMLKPSLARAKGAGFYHPDYPDDWELGDEPYRYYNW